MQTRKIYDLIVRKKATIKSRHWWLRWLKRFNKTLLSTLTKKDLKLAKNYTFTLLITTNNEIKKLNKNFRKINESTDVLSFHIKESKQHKLRYLGDIVISIEKAKNQAKENKIALEAELKMLLVHGYLHLLGYDHLRKTDAKTMFSLQENLLKRMENLL